jgi:hypothetical protein
MMTQQELELITRAIAGAKTLLAETQTSLQALRMLIHQNEAELAAAQKTGSLSPADLLEFGQEIATLRQQEAGMVASISQQEANIMQSLGTLLADPDPRSQVSLLDDHVPVMLFPVKVETRFMTIKHIARVQTGGSGPGGGGGVEEELFVGPGGGEEELFEGPGGLSGGQVPTGGPGVPTTAAGIPLIPDRKELWVRIFPDDIAVHTHEPWLTFAEQQAGERYWTEIWYAGPSDGLRLGAWRALCGGRGGERAAWVAKMTTPTNQALQPTVTTNRQDPLPVSPTCAAAALKLSPWTQPPQARVLPDRFVVRLYQGQSHREVVGNPIPDPLQLMMNPDGSEEFENGATDLDFPAKLKWLDDFGAAEAAGMAIRVALSPAEALSGFDRLLVLGVKTAADKTDSQLLLETLLENHHYKDGGLSLLPQGTPTNNSKDADSGYARNRSDDDLWAVEQGPLRYTATSDNWEKTDGQRLAEALGIDHAVMQRIQFADQGDIKEAMATNRALWLATLGYYLPQIAHPLFSKQDIKATRGHFCEYVLGRGALPAIRVDDQPYGILPTTAFSRWQYKGGSEGSFNDRLLRNILRPAEFLWESVLDRVPYAGDPNGNASATFLGIMGLHASSVEFYQRFFGGPFFMWNLFNFRQHLGQGGINNHLPLANPLPLNFVQDFKNMNFRFPVAPRVFEFVSMKDPKFLNGPLIDSNPLSETLKIKEMATGWNYIQWLSQAGFLDVRDEKFSLAGLPEGSPAPNALLYLMLRHSYLLAYVKTGIDLLVAQELVSEFAYLDAEMINIGVAQGLTPDHRSMIQSRIETRENLRLDAEVETDAQAQLEVMRLGGQLNNATPAQIAAILATLRDNLRAAAQPVLATRISAAVDTVTQNFVGIPNKLTFLEQVYPTVTGTLTLLAHIEGLLATHAPAVAEIEIVQNALLELKDLPTARLERCLTEHTDLLSYRLDAWFYSLVHDRLATLRDAGEGNRHEGIYLGAYSWLEDLIPSNFEGLHYEEVELQPGGVSIPGLNVVTVVPGGNLTSMDLMPIYGRSGNMSGGGGAVPAPLPNGLEVTGNQTLLIEGITNDLRELAPTMEGDAFALDTPNYMYLGTGMVGPISYDSASQKFVPLARINPENLGHILAPSVNHAIAAAVLRAGYNSHAENQGSPDNAFAVNLSSQRVRNALFYTEGIRNGQEMAALLGYQFERNLHDLDPTLNQYVYALRQMYPLVAGRVTENGAGEDPSQAEANNVVNGLTLLEAYRAGLWATNLSPAPTNAERLRLESLIQELANSLDAIADLMTAEAVYQTVQGNSTRAGAALKVMNGRGAPIDPEVIQTPRRVHHLIHRVGAFFDSSAGGETVWFGPASARSIAAPELNRWLGTRLPSSQSIVINCSYRLQGPVGTVALRLADLQLQPIDLYYMLSGPTHEGEASELSSYIHYYLMQQNMDGVTDLSIQYLDRGGMDPADRTIYEILPLIKQLKVLIDAARPLQGRDFLLDREALAKIEANPTGGIDTSALFVRVQALMGQDIGTGVYGLEGLVNAFDRDIAILDNVSSYEYPTREEADASWQLCLNLLAAAGMGTENGYPETTVSFHEAAITAMVAKAKGVNKDLKVRLLAAQAILDALVGVTDEEQRSEKLQAAAQAIFGRSFKVFPGFRHYDVPTQAAAQAYTGYTSYAGPLALHEWLQSLAPVRPRMGAWARMGHLTQALIGTPGNSLAISQLPLTPLSEVGTGSAIAQWYGTQFDPAYPVPDENLSLVMQLPDGNYDAAALHHGFMFDEWNEEIPINVAEPGLAIHYDNPDGFPPQACLLAVTPELTGSWSWDHLMDTLYETLDWSKKRAVDPEALKKTPHTQVLPALVAAMSSGNQLPVLDFGRNNAKYLSQDGDRLIQLAQEQALQGGNYSEVQLSFENNG